MLCLTGCSRRLVQWGLRLHFYGLLCGDDDGDNAAAADDDDGDNAAAAVAKDNNDS